MLPLRIPRGSVASPSAILVVLVTLIPAALVMGRSTTRREGGAAVKDEDKMLLERLVTAVEDGLHFFAQDYSSINVDGIFGMRVGQGQIIQAVEVCKSSGSCPETLLHRLQDLVQKIDVTAREAMKYAKEGDVDYFSRFIKVINNPYLVEYSPAKLEALDKTPIGSDSSYDEEMGDACFARILGTYQDTDVDGKKLSVSRCNVTRSCWSFMTEQDRSKYAITHQLLYFVIIEKEGCVEAVETSMGTNVAETEKRMCGSIYNEAVSEVKDDNVGQMSQDLFLEQVLVCGTLGYENFMRADWMRMALRWQKPSGCYSLDNPKLLETEKKLSENQNRERQLMKQLQWEVEMIEKQHDQQYQGRKLLREKIMTDGCLAHKTGLGFGVLSLYTHYMVRLSYRDH